MTNDERLMKAGQALMLDLEDRGFTAYMVGGTVRNEMLGIPIKDIDIVTNCPMETLKEHYKCFEIGKGKKNGALLVRGLGEFSDLHFDVVQFRKEEQGEYSDGRRPDKVVFGATMDEDAVRRDFTVNALYMDRHGNVIDPTGRGVDDIKGRVLRSVCNPAIMLNDDKVRILRAMRFMAVFEDFAMDIETGTAINKLAAEIAKEPTERICKELYSAAEKGGHILANMISFMDFFGVLRHALPEVHAFKGLVQNEAHHPEGDVYEHTLAALRASDSKDPLTLIAVLFHDIGKTVTYEFHKDRGHTYFGHDEAGDELARQAARRLHLSNDYEEVIAFCARNHMRGHRIGEMKPSKVHAMVRSKHFPILKHVVFCDEACRGVGKFNPDETANRFADAEVIADQVDARIAQAETAKVVDGRQIIKAAEIAGKYISGPQIGLIKNFVIDKVLNAGVCPSKIDDLIDQALQQC